MKHALCRFSVAVIPANLDRDPANSVGNLGPAGQLSGQSLCATYKRPPVCQTPTRAP